MNRDTHLIFEAYRQKQLELINEMDMGAERGAFIGGVASGLKKRREEYKQKKGKNPDEYIISDLVGKGEAHDKAIEKIASDVYDKLFEDGVFRARGDRKMQLDTLQNKILETLVSLGYTSTKSGWTARILRAAAESILKDIEEKEATGDDVTQADVQDAVEDSIEGIAKEVQQTPAGKAEVSKVNVEQFVPSPTVKYTFESDVRVNALSTDEEQEIYNAVDKSEPYTGSDLLEYLKDEVRFNPRKDLNEEKIISVLNKLISKKILVGQGEGEFDSTDTEDVQLDPNQYLAKHHGGTQFGARPSGKALFGGEGGRYGVDFG
jgi:hypothetical protein